LFLKLKSVDLNQ